MSYRPYRSPEEHAPPPDWISAAERIKRSVRTIQQSHTREDRTPKAVRDVHPKHHGLLLARFVVESEETFESLQRELGVDLRIGVFARSGHSYPCWIRYSSTNKVPQSDDIADGRGVAIKLIDVPQGASLPEGSPPTFQEGTQDFLLVNGPTFFAKDAEEMTIAAELEAQDLFPSDFLLTRPRALIATVTPLRSQAPSPLDLDYFSQTPYSLGPHLTAKYSVRRPKKRNQRAQYEKGANHLREQLRADLDGSFDPNSTAISLDFCVQLGLQDESFPIDDATVVWDERRSPFVRLARIEIPSQRFEHKSRFSKAECIEFNPFHALSEHRPLGSINFARGFAYAASQSFRRQARTNAEAPLMTYQREEWEAELTHGQDTSLAAAPLPQVADQSRLGVIVDTAAHLVPGLQKQIWRFFATKTAYILPLLLLGSCSYYHYHHPSGGVDLNLASVMPSEARIPPRVYNEKYRSRAARRALETNGAYLFAHHETGTEYDAGLPYWVFRALPLITPEYFGGYPDYRIHGFDVSAPSEFIDNYHGLPRGVVLSDTTMYLLGTKVELKLKRVSFNCATCHSGEYQDESGKRVVVWGMPANVIDTVGFKTAFHQAARDPRFTAQRLIEAINEVFAADAQEQAGTGVPEPAPRLTPTEEFIYGQIAAEIKKQAFSRPLKWMSLRPENGPGRVDAFGALRFEYLRFSQNEDLAEYQAGQLRNSVVDLPSVWNQRASYRPYHHWDGNTKNGRARNFGAIVGVGGRSYSIHQKEVGLIGKWIDELPAPRYPFPPRAKAQVERGKELYTQNCQDCHGQYEEQKLLSVTACMKEPIVVGTDEGRARAVDDALIRSLNQFGQNTGLWGPRSFRNTGKYLCPPLDGIWARAPFLHNGSVPTLDDLLRSEAQRPKRFYRGNTRYDQNKGGFVSDEKPDTSWKHRAFEFVTQEEDEKNAGNSARGHDFSVPDESDRQALIAYLLTL